MVVRRENRLAADGVVEALRDRPGDRHAVVGRRAAPDLVEQHQAAGARGVKNGARFAHFDHEGGLPAHEVVGRPDAREQPIDDANPRAPAGDERTDLRQHDAQPHLPEHGGFACHVGAGEQREDRKSTRLNSSHVEISYAVFCLKKKKKKKKQNKIKKKKKKKKTIIKIKKK